MKAVLALPTRVEENDNGHQVLSVGAVVIGGVEYTLESEFFDSFGHAVQGSYEVVRGNGRIVATNVDGIWCQTYGYRTVHMGHCDVRCPVVLAEDAQGW